MTVDVGKQKLLEEIIRKEKKEAEASHYEAFKVLEEDARFNATRISEEVGENYKQLLDQYRAKKIIMIGMLERWIRIVDIFLKKLHLLILCRKRALLL